MNGRDVNTVTEIPENILREWGTRLQREWEAYTRHRSLIQQGRGYVGATIIRATDAMSENPMTYDIIEAHNFQLFYPIDEGRALDFVYNDGGWLIVGYWKDAPHASGF